MTVTKSTTSVFSGRKKKPSSSVTVIIDFRGDVDVRDRVRFTVEKRPTHDWWEGGRTLEVWTGAGKRSNLITNEFDVKRVSHDGRVKYRFELNAETCEYCVRFRSSNVSSLCICCTRRFGPVTVVAAIAK